jgi:DNA-directed RNA polymerase subunit RPC12/RpoP
LTDIGYRPILSSSEGFHDKSPNLEPWESCIPVLENCFVTILIIDGRYGYALPWPNYPDLPKTNSPNRKKVSPTHGEYLHAHTTRQRMLVFVRREVMTHYQSYTKNIDFKVLDFLNEVKTTKPIPWIKEFDDVTTVKKEVHKKMLNELAEVFMIKNQHFETVVKVFNRAMDELSEDKQKEILQKINATKDITEVRESLIEKQKELEKIKKERKGNKASEQAKTEKIKKLERKINRLEQEIESSDSLAGRLLVESDGKVRINTSNQIFIDPPIDYSNTNRTIGFFGDDYNKCSKCDKTVDNNSLLGSYETMNKCSYCGNKYCQDCWPKNSIVGFYELNKCPECKK